MVASVEKAPAVKAQPKVAQASSLTAAASSRKKPSNDVAFTSKVHDVKNAAGSKQTAPSQLPPPLPSGRYFQDINSSVNAAIQAEDGIKAALGGAALDPFSADKRNAIGAAYNHKDDVHTEIRSDLRNIVAGASDAVREDALSNISDQVGGPRSPIWVNYLSSDSVARLQYQRDINQVNSER